MLKKLDKIDFLILKELTTKADQNSIMLSQKLNLSSKTIRNRLHALKREGVFESAIVINPFYFGYNIRLDFFIKIENKFMNKLINFVMQEFKFNLLYVGTHWGDDNISLQCVFKKTSDVVVFQNAIEKIAQAKIIQMNMVPIVIRDTFKWLPKPTNFKMSLDETTQYISEKSEIIKLPEFKKTT